MLIKKCVLRKRFADTGGKKMAGRYTHSELKSKLHRSTYQVVKTAGIEGLTVRKVVQGCGFSDPYLYRCYGDLNELLQDAFMAIDEKVSGMIAQVIRLNLSNPDHPDRKSLDDICWTIWSAYWNFLMEDPDQTVFYWRFYQSGRYSRELEKKRQENFGVFIDFLNQVGRIICMQDRLKQLNLDTLTSNIIDDTVSVAVKIHLGYITENPGTAKLVYESAFALLFHLLGRDIWKETAADGHIECSHKETA